MKRTNIFGHAAIAAAMAAGLIATLYRLQRATKRMHRAASRKPRRPRYRHGAKRYAQRRVKGWRR